MVGNMMYFTIKYRQSKYVVLASTFDSACKLLSFPTYDCTLEKVEKYNYIWRG